MKKLIFVMLIGLCSFGVMAQTSCMQDPAGNIQCTGFNDDGEMIQSTTTQTPNGNYETNGVVGNRPYNQSCYTTPGGNLICN